MSRTFDGGGDDRVADARAKARLAKEQADARRARVRADLAERQVIRLDEAREQVLALATSVKRALDLLPSFLPSDLSPENRDACNLAMEQAVSRAMAAINREESRAQYEA
jgi:hypothetical protein